MYFLLHCYSSKGPIKDWLTSPEDELREALVTIQSLQYQQSIFLCRKGRLLIVKQREMEILGAGFCRTGTMSTRKALVDLGLTPCFHMESVVTQSHSFYNTLRVTSSPWLTISKMKDTKPGIALLSISLHRSLTQLPQFVKSKAILKPPQTFPSFALLTSLFLISQVPRYFSIFAINLKPGSNRFELRFGAL